ncbi:MAG: NYN domain-containing protein [Candidatus Diapherotrites archaeon]|jgi:uncharacterized LabA/DUF88 family protein|nr:NYN domain-containing protein [Candidatus Diapherotrites archaeon]MBT4596719.1 NYN domain-containing protein [Candidatus Diapherotrites archaeon]
MLKDSFLRTINTLIINYLPAIAGSTAGYFYKISIFIDGSNFYHSLKKSFNITKIDVKKLSKILIAENELQQIFYYTSPINRKENLNAYKAQQRFLAKIKKVPKLMLFLGRLEKRGNGKVEKGVDVKLAVDLISNAFKDRFDIAIIISNDADFVPAIKEVQNRGKKVFNVSFPKTKSFHLNKVCDRTIKIDSVNEFELT